LKHAYLDSTPIPDYKAMKPFKLRERSPEKEIGPKFRFKPINSVERAYDAVKQHSCRQTVMRESLTSFNK
jgi:hypothetical protein